MLAQMRGHRPAAAETAALVVATAGVAAAVVTLGMLAVIAVAGVAVPVAGAVKGCAACRIGVAEMVET
jgi:hypothetical protein